jgi:L-threonylcarbamoyladenylate synthase
MKTEVYRISDPSAPEIKILEIAAEKIRAGGLVVFPTETVYGLGADATNEAAVASIFSAKGRPSDNPLIIHVSEPRDADNYAYTSDMYYKLAKRFMPGPLTVILRSRDNIPKKTRGGLDTVAVRCPESLIARELIRLSKTPIAAPSANLSGSPSPTSAEHVIKDMTGRVDMIIDGGSADFGLESTIVKIEDNGTLTLLRPGKITVEELLDIAPVTVADAVTDELKEGEVALSPGMKYRHYAPKAPLILVEGRAEALADYIDKANSKKIAVIAYDEDVDILASLLANVRIYSFGSAADALSQAHNLFSLLREADAENFDEIYAPLPKTDGVSLALYNRMIRAAAHKIIRL